MKKTVAFLLFTVCFVNTGTAQRTRPNIIIFLVDDMGWQDCSVPFWTQQTMLNQKYRTPNMERLAAEGMKFTDAYAAPVCTPSRTAMLTGMSPARLHITNWTSPAKNTNTNSRDNELDLPDWNMNGLSPVPGIQNTAYATPFPQILKKNGYYTIHVGKAHWGSVGTPGANPYNMGFLVNISGHAAGHPQSYLANQNYGNYPKMQPGAQAVPGLEEYYGSDTFLTEALTIEALKALDEPIRRKQPFYLNMSHYAVHTPIMPDPRFIKKYLDAGLDSIEAAYATLVEGMDKSLGDIMDYLKQKGIDNNTVIIFMSDNGGLDHHQRGGAINTHNYPLRSGKGSVYEGGIREPMIVKWPEVIRKASVCEQPVIIEDFFPSILEIAQTEKPKFVQQLDGRSFVSILKEPQTLPAERPLIFHYPNKWININTTDEARLGINYHSAMRYGDYKLIYRMRTQTFELYNLSVDLKEEHDLAQSHRDDVKKLARILGKKLKEQSAQMPVSKITGKNIPYPDEIIK